MSVRRFGWVGLGFVVFAGFGCTTETTNGGGSAGSASLPLPGTAAPVAGATGAAGMFAAGTGGVGVAGQPGTAGTFGAPGTAGVGAAGAPAAGTGGVGGAAGAPAAGTGGSGGADAAQMCIDDAAAMGRTGACTECGCMKCLDAINNCQDEACASVVACGQANGCKGRDCYCGAHLDAIGCAINGAEGPCMMEIATAAGVCDAAALDTCASTLSNVTNPSSDMYDANNPVSRANGVSVCTRGQAADPGIPGLVPAVDAIAGMCETECAM